MIILLSAYESDQREAHSNVRRTRLVQHTTGLRESQQFLLCPLSTIFLLIRRRLGYAPNCAISNWTLSMMLPLLDFFLLSPRFFPFFYIFHFFINFFIILILFRNSCPLRAVMSAFATATFARARPTCQLLPHTCPFPRSLSR